MSGTSRKRVCHVCRHIEGDNKDFKNNLLREAGTPYGEVEFICPNCGARNRMGEGTEDTDSTRAAPRDEKEMREAIISTLKRLYPTRTGYNGGHLALIRDPNPDLFFQVLHELETEGVIEYNDTQIAMRLSEKSMRMESVT